MTVGFKYIDNQQAFASLAKVLGALLQFLTTR